LELLIIKLFFSNSKRRCSKDQLNFLFGYCSILSFKGCSNQENQ